DTFGFPLDLTQDALREQGRTVDTEGFKTAMEAQKAKARAAWSGSGDVTEDGLWFDLREEIGATEFLGYDTETAEGVVKALVRDGQRASSAKAGETVQIILNQTPFYAESGGQVGDHGTLRTVTGRARVTDVRKRAGDLFVHEAVIETGEIVQGEAAELGVDSTRRGAIRANHSATHLLHEALRGALGDHVAQRGSLVAPDRLRFDFAHQKAMAPAEIAAVEAEANRYIRQNDAVTTRIMTPDEAQDAGARALFGEKYGDEVRVVTMGQRPQGQPGPAGSIYSMELCGGTHVARTGDIGLLKVVGESASSAGIRRIEALTGAAALDYLEGQEKALAKVASALRSRPMEAADRVQALLDERKALQAELADLKRQIALGGTGSGAPEPEAKEINGVKFLARSLTGINPKDLRGLIDEHKSRLGSGAVLLIAESDGKATVAAGVTDDLTARISAVDLVRVAVEVVGGKGGGGRPDMAQGGGPDASKAEDAIRAAEALLGGLR
ncbi:MAG TPA: alanine--tRNA ligase-related protein, partial [Devosiaceae bacterium]|nr:alanine--tRNA ligase-related protein [Devosiaceae bacterium]